MSVIVVVMSVAVAAVIVIRVHQIIGKVERLFSGGLLMLLKMEKMKVVINNLMGGAIYDRDSEVGFEGFRDQEKVSYVA